MSELNPFECDLNLLNDRILNLSAGLATMPENGTMQVSKAFLTAILGYMEELLGMRRTQPANDPLTLKELREIAESSEFGSHIWVKEAGTEFVYAAITDVVNGDGVVAVWNADGDWFVERDYGKTWLAYRRPPERSENDAKV